MKKTIYIIALIFLTLTVKAQTKGSVSYSSTFSGRNISLSLSKTYLKYELGIGIRCNVNRRKHNDDQSYAFKNRLYAENALQHFGITGFYHRMIFSEWKDIKPFLFYNIQTSYAQTRNEDYVYVGTDSRGFEYYNLVGNHYGPFFWLEQYVGVGFKINLTGNFYMTQQIGVGPSLIIGEKETFVFENFDGFKTKIGTLVNFGITYRFK